MHARPTILLFIATYLPGYKSGGPVRTISNLVEALHGNFRFKIVTADRDFGDKEPYLGIERNKWLPVGSAEVYYIAKETRSLSLIKKIVSETAHDIIYLNSFFDPVFSILPIIAAKVGPLADKPILLAPRGEFSSGALAIKAYKKKSFIAVAKFIRLYRQVFWHASTPFEQEDIRRVLGGSADRIVVAQNIAEKIPDWQPKESSNSGSSINIIFLSRISPKKNLDFAIKVLAEAKSQISFTIAGPVSDFNYWAECQRLLTELPPNVQAHYVGNIKPPEVKPLLRTFDLFFLPTHGENYGHAIAEALSVGTPVLISDTTPWRGLSSRGVGWELPLDNPDRFAQVVDEYAEMSEADKERMSQRARDFAIERIGSPEIIEQNLRMFNLILGGNAS